jgi:short-subunit dehydrogenase involved in D-alanine esterification of teichoic acids
MATVCADPMSLRGHTLLVNGSTNGLGRAVAVKHLDRHPPVVLEVLRQVDGGHAAHSERALYAIALAQGFG